MFIVHQVGKYDVASDIELVLFGYEFIDDNTSFNISYMY